MAASDPGHPTVPWGGVGSEAVCDLQRPHSGNHTRPKPCPPGGLRTGQGVGHQALAPALPPLPVRHLGPGRGFHKPFPVASCSGPLAARAVLDPALAPSPPGLTWASMPPPPCTAAPPVIIEVAARAAAPTATGVSRTALGGTGRVPCVPVLSSGGCPPRALPSPPSLQGLCAPSLRGAALCAHPQLPLGTQVGVAVPCVRARQGQGLSKDLWDGPQLQPGRCAVTAGLGVTLSRSATPPAGRVNPQLLRQEAG